MGPAREDQHSGRRSGLGKSVLTLDLAARISIGGKLPCGCPSEQGAIILKNVEDGLHDTIRPRLEAACADLCRIVALRTVMGGEGARQFELSQDLQLLKGEIEFHHAVLVVVDPLVAFLSEKIRYFSDQDIRRVLAPLADLAE